MQFLAFVAAIIVLLITAGIAAVGFSVFGPQTIAVAMLGTVGFTIAGYHAYHAAKPIPFEFAGSYPSAWAEDIDKDLPFNEAIAQQLNFYDRNLNRNRESAEISGKALESSARVVIATVVSSGVLAFALVVTQVVSTLPSAA